MCTALENLYIPESVNSISPYAFPLNNETYNNIIKAAFSKFEVDNNNTKYKSIDGILYSKDGKNSFISANKLF